MNKLHAPKKFSMNLKECTDKFQFSVPKINIDKIKATS